MKTVSEHQTEISLYPILTVNFIGTLGFGIVLPFLIFLVTKYGGNAVIYGIMGATYSAFQLVGAPLLGKWSDHYGRRKVLILSQIGTLLSWLIFLVAMFLPNMDLLHFDSEFSGTFILTLPLVILFFARALDGITGGNVSVANAYLSDITIESNRNKNFGKMAIAANMGYILGPALAGILGNTAWGEKLPVIAALLISTVAVVVIWILLPESELHVLEKDPERLNVRKMMGQEQKECFEIQCKESLSFFEALKLKDIGYLLILNFLVFLGFNFFYVAFPVHVVRVLHWDLTDTGYFFSFLSIVMVIVQGPVLNSVSKKWNDGRLVFWGSFILAVSFLFYIIDNRFVIYTGAVLLALGNGIMWPSLLSLTSKISKDRFQGVIQGYASSLGSAASIIGLLAGGMFYNQIGVGIFVLSSAIIFLIFIMSFKLPGNYKT